MVVCASTVTDSRNRKDAVKAAHASGRAKWRVKDMIMLRNVVYSSKLGPSCAGPNQELLHSIFAGLQSAELAAAVPLASVHLP